MKPAQREQLEDAIAGRWLAWIGGAATLLGVCLLLALAVSHGWIGHTGRIVLAALGCTGLLGGGAWMRERIGRIEASLAMICAGTVGWYATLLVADTTYGLVGDWPAMLGGVAVGAIAVALSRRWSNRAIEVALSRRWNNRAIEVGLSRRWSNRTIAALGLLGPLILPWCVDPDATVLHLVVLCVVAGAGLAVALRERWSWLAVAVLSLAQFDAIAWLLSTTDAPIDRQPWSLVPFALAALVAAVVEQRRAADGQRSRPALVMLVGTALLLLAAIGLGDPGSVSDGPILTVSQATITAWLIGVAVGYAALGILAARRAALEPLIAPAFTIVTAVLDIALAINLHGIALTASFAAAGLGIAGVRRLGAPRISDRAIVDLGLAGHVVLVLVRALAAAPPNGLASGTISPDGLLAIAILAGLCLSTSRLTRDENEAMPSALAVVGIAAIAYLSALTLSGAALVAMWGAEAVTLAAIGRRHSDPIAAVASLAFLAGVWAHTMIGEAPPVALLTGATSLPAAVLALAAAAGATAAVRRTLVGEDSDARLVGDDSDARLVGDDLDARLSAWLFRLTAVAPLYLASVAIITVFQPAVSAGIDVLDLSVQQQGQVLMSALWTLSGLSCLIVGLRRDLLGLRHAGIVLLLVSAAKVFLYDLSTLTSVYRVVSFIVLGLLLLAGAFAYQRLRPPALPDLRQTTPAER